MRWRAPWGMGVSAPQACGSPPGRPQRAYVITPALGDVPQKLIKSPLSEPPRALGAARPVFAGVPPGQPQASFRPAPGQPQAISGQLPGPAPGQLQASPRRAPGHLRPAPWASPRPAPQTSPRRAPAQEALLYLAFFGLISSKIVHFWSQSAAFVRPTRPKTGSPESLFWAKLQSHPVQMNSWLPTEPALKLIAGYP